MMHQSSRGWHGSMFRRDGCQVINFIVSSLFISSFIIIIIILFSSAFHRIRSCQAHCLCWIPEFCIALYCQQKEKKKKRRKKKDSGMDPTAASAKTITHSSAQYDSALHEQVSYLWRYFYNLLKWAAFFGHFCWYSLLKIIVSQSFSRSDR